MFTAVELAPLATGAVELAPLVAPTFGGLSALGAEFGTAGLFAEAGTNASILNAIGAGSGAAVPTLAEGIASGVTTGGLGAGEVGINQAMVTADQMQAANYGFSQAELEAMQQGQELARNARELGQVAEGTGNGATQELIQNARGLEQVGPAAERFANTQNLMQNAGPVQSDMLTKESLRLPIDEVGTNYQNFPPVEGSQRLGQVFAETLPSEYTPNTTIPQQTTSNNPLANGFKTAMDFAKNNPFSAASMAYSASNLLKKSPEEEEPEEYNGILKRYKMSPNFQGRQANPADFQYTPKVYAEGGIASFKSGSKVDFDPTGGSKIAGDYYESMLREQARNMPSTKSDPGIIYDTDPDTRSLDPVSAAQIRMAKINKRSNIQAQNMKRPTRLGQINLSPPGAKAEESSASVDAARGGIMHARRYADGGITGNGNLNLNIPLDLGGGGGYGGGGGNGGGAYPFQNNGGFLGNNNAPQVTSNPSLVANQAQRMAQQAQDQAQRMQPYQTSPPLGLGAPQGPFPFTELPEPQDVSSMKGTTFGGNPQQGMSSLMGLLGGQGMAGGGMTSLGGYAAGGNPRLLKGPGDGMSDNIPATIAGKQPARLADGEFVIPADVVSHLGNGSTEAGAKILHAMMTKVRKERTGNPKQGKQINPRKFVPT
jgi:hypothetical protein